MNIYPAIDLKSGECVRLYQGSFDQVTSYHSNPVEVAKNFYAQGAKFLHIVDLDGAKSSTPKHADLIKEIAQKTALKIQVGGGIRTKPQILELLKVGIQRVILGSVAVFQPEMVKEWLQEFPDQIVLALDIRMDENQTPNVTSQGWQQDNALTLWQLLDFYQEMKPHILCTDIARDGTLTGPNFNLYRECMKRYPSLKFQASGGIQSLDDVLQLSEIPMSAAIIGKAIYENKFSVNQLFSILN